MFKFLVFPPDNGKTLQAFVQEYAAVSQSFGKSTLAEA